MDLSQEAVTGVQEVIDLTEVVATGVGLQMRGSPAAPATSVKVGQSSRKRKLDESSEWELADKLSGFTLLRLDWLISMPKQGLPQLCGVRLKVYGRNWQPEPQLSSVSKVKLLLLPDQSTGSAHSSEDHICDIERNQQSDR